MKAKLKEVDKLVPYIKLEKKEKLASRLPTEEEYDSLFTTEEVETLVSQAPSYYIDPEKCQACMICARNCPTDAIISAKKTVHVIEQEKCIKCGTCLDVCPPKFNAVVKLSGERVPAPVGSE